MGKDGIIITLWNFLDEYVFVRLRLHIMQNVNGEMGQLPRGILIFVHETWDQSFSSEFAITTYSRWSLFYDHCMGPNRLCPVDLVRCPSTCHTYLGKCADILWNEKPYNISKIEVIRLR